MINYYQLHKEFFAINLTFFPGHSTNQPQMFNWLPMLYSSIFTHYEITLSVNEHIQTSA